jgi:mercuric ion transport protein
MGAEVRLRHSFKIRKNKRMAEQQSGRTALFTGGLAAVLASTSCLVPLVGRIVGERCLDRKLTVLPTMPANFIGAALVALFFVKRHIFRAAQACKAGEVRAIPKLRTAYKLFSGKKRRFWLL